MVSGLRLLEHALGHLGSGSGLHEALIQGLDELAPSNGLKVVLEMRKGRLIAVGDDQHEPTVPNLSIRAPAQRQCLVEVGELGCRESRRHPIEKVNPLLANPSPAAFLPS